MILSLIHYITRMWDVANASKRQTISLSEKDYEKVGDCLYLETKDLPGASVELKEPSNVKWLRIDGYEIIFTNLTEKQLNEKLE